MVESYSKNANHNMRRPVVKEEIVDLMRQRQKQVTGSLKELEDFAHKENIPIIPHETVAYFRFLMEIMQPKNILEIGTAIGFSALLMAEHVPDAKITTIDRKSYDFVFMDSAKSKYIVFLPEILKHLEVGGVVVLDDIFQGGDVAKDIMEVRRGQRTIYRGLQRLFDATLDNPGLTATLVPLGDGILMLRKNVADVQLPESE